MLIQVSLKSELAQDVTPEAGAQFEIYLKSSGSFDDDADSERDLLVCDEFGYADSKDLPYLETREKEDAFLQRIMETVERGVQANSLSSLAALLQTSPPGAPSQDAAAVEEDLETALDFVNSL